MNVGFMDTAVKNKKKVKTPEAPVIEFDPITSLFLFEYVIYVYVLYVVGLARAWPFGSRSSGANERDRTQCASKHTRTHHAQGPRAGISPC